MDADTTLIAPPSPAIEAHGSAAGGGTGGGGGGLPAWPGPFANGLVVVLPGPTRASEPERLQAPSESEASRPAAASRVVNTFGDEAFMGVPPVRVGSHGMR